MTDLSTIIAAVDAALSQRDSRRNILASRIATLADAAMEAARVRRIDLGAAGLIQWRVPVADCSQWGNRMDYPDHEGETYTALVIDGDVTCLEDIPDCGFWDGNNAQRQQGPTRDQTTGQRLRRPTVATLKAAARELPTAIAALLSATLATAEAETADADATLATLPVE